jgi:hypothetical protein
MGQKKESSYCESSGFLDVDYFLLLMRKRIRNAISSYFANCRVAGGYRSFLFFLQIENSMHVIFLYIKTLFCSRTDYKYMRWLKLPDLVLILWKSLQKLYLTYQRHISRKPV